MNTLIGGKLRLKNDKVFLKTKRQFIASEANNNIGAKNNRKEEIKVKKVKEAEEEEEDNEERIISLDNVMSNEERKVIEEFEKEIGNDIKDNVKKKSIELFNQMTPAEKLFEERRLQRLPNKIKKMTNTSFKEEYQRYYKSLTKLPEHHDIPKVGPG